MTTRYVFATMTKEEILALADEAIQTGEGDLSDTVISHIWEDRDIKATLTRSLATIKADKVQARFGAHGERIVWAVMDSGIQGDHPHFHNQNVLIDNLALAQPLEHMDFTPLQNGALVDEYGHGSHLAGIIAGSWASSDPAGEPVAASQPQVETGVLFTQRFKLDAISGVAPKCKIVSLKVIADRTVSGPLYQKTGGGKVSWVLLAIDQIQRWNQYGSKLLIHGVNLGFGYEVDPRWTTTGQTPICLEVDRLVRSGVIVVAAAGNSGLGIFSSTHGRAGWSFADMTIMDPGNADLAITVGSTNPETPLSDGVSSWSSRGPTGDGRLKPDLVAPGENIVSCASGNEAQTGGLAADGAGKDCPILYRSLSGTSVAAAHVSGAIAAFLSVHREFIGDPERVKEVFLAGALDLRRERRFQGAGLLDLMKVFQSI